LANEPFSSVIPEFASVSWCSVDQRPDIGGWDEGAVAAIDHQLQMLATAGAAVHPELKLVVAGSANG
jgi:hypothetical protein